MARWYAAEDGVEPISDTFAEIVGNQGTYNIISGCSLSYDAADMTVDLAAGVITFDGSLVNVSTAANAYTVVSDPTNPRWTWLALDSAGTAAMVSGDPAATPTVPELGDRVPLALLLVQAAQTIAANITYKLDQRVPAGGFPKMIAQGAVPEVTGNATGATDILTFTLDSVPASSELVVQGNYRKTSGAASTIGLGFKLNSTTVYEAAVSTWTSATDRAENGWFEFTIPARTSTYDTGFRTAGTYGVTGGTTNRAAVSDNTVAAAMPTAALTSLAIRAITGNSNVTYGIYNVRVYRNN